MTLSELALIEKALILSERDTYIHHEALVLIRRELKLKELEQELKYDVKGNEMEE